MIPQVEPCRFMSIAQIHRKVADDSFAYKSVRVIGKVVKITPQMHRLEAEDPGDPTQSLVVDIFLLKHREIEKGKIYEFLGEIEQVKDSLATDAQDAAMQSEEGAQQQRNSPPAQGPQQSENQGHTSGVFLKARILKDQAGFHKLVYQESVSQVNLLIESLVNRGKEN